MFPPISTILTPRKLPLLLHIIIESAAAYTFILKPSVQLPPSLLDHTSSNTPTSPSCFTSSTCACHSPEETRQQPSKRYLSPSPSSSSPSPSPTLPPPDYSAKAKDEKTTPEEVKELNLILLNYGGLLLTSNLICLIFLFRPIFDELSGVVSLAMATYHVWPVWRAWSRIRIRMSNNDTNENMKGAPGGKVLGGPVVHLVVHLGLLGGLVLAGLV